MSCYIIQTASFLPGLPVGNDDIQRFLGTLPGEADVKDRILSMNGIRQRHYALDEQQQVTDCVYQMGANAAAACIDAIDSASHLTYLSSGTTYAPLAAPGLASLLHSRLAESGHLRHPVEVSSHGGICCSSAAAFVSATRSINAGLHRGALAVGVEHASEVLKSTRIRPVDDREQHENIRNSQWFMSVFLRFMLSDGAGAIALSNTPRRSGLSLRVNWTHSLSFAHEAPLCMKLDNANALLSQDVAILSKHLFPAAGRVVKEAFARNNDTLDRYRMVLPHISSFFFRRKMEKLIASHCGDATNPVPYWTNLATVGNTGAASIYIMLDHYLREHELCDDDHLLLFIPESGQFNFVMVSLTAVRT